ncbi:fluoride efflux transporter CrcB [soil metagenome]
MNWPLLGLVMLGGALGAGMRHLIGGWLLVRIGHGLPWGTLAANLLGAFAAGFLFAWLEGRGPAALYWRAFLIVGLLGALTTFSALMLESMLYARSGRLGAYGGYLALSLAGGFLLVWLGARAGTLLRA